MALDIHYEKERHTGRWVFFIVLIVGLVGAGWGIQKWYMTGETPIPLASLVSADTPSDSTPITSQQISTYTVADSNPRYIAIPSLKLPNARIFPVKLNASNEIASTSNLNDASWYEKSTTPGSGGVVVLGVDTTSESGIFTQVKTLKPGTAIALTRGDDKLFTYTVQENKSLSLDEMQSIGAAQMGKSAKDGTEGLNIVTTDGKFVPHLGTYDRRVLIRATLAE